jgi:hypothetical protein
MARFPAGPGHTYRPGPAGANSSPTRAPRRTLPMQMRQALLLSLSVNPYRLKHRYLSPRVSTPPDNFSLVRFVVALFLLLVSVSGFLPFSVCAFCLLSFSLSSSPLLFFSSSIAEFSLSLLSLPLFFSFCLSRSQSFSLSVFLSLFLYLCLFVFRFYLSFPVFMFALVCRFSRCLFVSFSPSLFLSVSLCCSLFFSFSVFPFFYLGCLPPSFFVSFLLSFILCFLLFPFLSVDPFFLLFLLSAPPRTLPHRGLCSRHPIYIRGRSDQERVGRT